jgi:hypothetical protein
MRRRHHLQIDWGAQEDEHLACWALPESGIVRALEDFVEHESRRPPFVQ